MLVYDKNIFGSNRSIDSNGYMRVEDCNITRTQVAPYKGSEIPNYEDFGLEPEKIYYVLRPAEELKKAVDTFNNLPLTRKHIAVDVDNVPKEDIVGSLGDSARFEDGFLKNSLIVYDQKYIDRIENGKQKELSCGYRYTPVRKSGEYEGQHYDFIMTDIIGNHVALVKEGRAGHDVVVADEKPADLEEKELNMTEDEKQTKAEQEKVGVVMKEFKEGELKSGSGEKVTDPKQAIAIALSEAKKAKDEDIPDEQDKPETAGEEKADKKDSKMDKEEKKESVAEVKEEDIVKDKSIDKRKLIDEIGGILKGKVDDELIRTIIGKAEQIAYNGSEAGEADDAEIKTKKEKEDFAKGVVYGEKKEKEEPKKLDSEHESEGMKKYEEKKAEDKCGKMAKDEAMAFDIDTIKTQVRQEMIADFKARDEARKSVKGTLGDINVMAFDSCEDIYKMACEKAGLNVSEIANYKDAFAGFSAGSKASKGRLALDASPTSGSNVAECLKKNIRI